MLADWVFARRKACIVTWIAWESAVSVGPRSCGTPFDAFAVDYTGSGQDPDSAKVGRWLTVGRAKFLPVWSPSGPKNGASGDCPSTNSRPPGWTDGGVIYHSISLTWNCCANAPQVSLDATP